MKISNDPFRNKMFVNQKMGFFLNILLSLFSGSFHTEEEMYNFLKLQNSLAVASQKNGAQ